MPDAAFIGRTHGIEHGSFDARLLADSKPRPEEAYQKSGGSEYLKAYFKAYDKSYRRTVGRGPTRIGRVDGVEHGRADAKQGGGKRPRPKFLQCMISDKYRTSYYDSYHLAFDMEIRVQNELAYRRELKSRLSAATTLNAKELRSIDLLMQKDQLRQKAQQDLER